MRSEHQGQGYNLVTALGHGLQNHILQGLISAKYPMNLIGRMPNQNCIFHKDTSTTSLTGIAGFILSSQWSTLRQLHGLCGAAAVSFIKAAIHGPKLFRANRIHSVAETALRNPNAPPQIRAKALPEYDPFGTVADRIDQNDISCLAGNASVIVLHRCHAAKALLVPLGIIEMDIFFDGEKPTHLLPQDVAMLYF